ncbi:MAG: DUF6101 family protein [Rhizobiaceae bacterium]
MAQVARQEVQGHSVRQQLPNWSEIRMRLDPYQLPHQVGYGRSDGLSFTIDRQGAVMKRKLSCGLAVSMALPASCFKGVAAHAVESPDGTITATLELHHHDPALSVPLLVSGDLDDIAADWHAWSRMMNLPMLIIESDNVARRITDRLGALMVEAPIERRKRFGTLKHRPWFLRRRKVGVVSEVTRITGEEIIARR